MPHQPSIREAWQDDEPEPLPTCYQERDPVAPWRAAAPELHDEFEDDEYAREFVATRGQVGMLGGSCNAACRIHTAAGPGAAAFPGNDTDVLSLPIIEQIRRKLHGSPA